LNIIFSKYVAYLLVSLLFLIQCGSQKEKEIMAANGVLDLRKVILEKQDNIPVRGDWEFYPREFLTSENIEYHTPVVSFNPSAWLTVDQNGESYSRNGFGTYRVKILLSQSYQGRDLALIIPEIASAYRLFLNNKLVVEQGEASQHYRDTKAFIKPRLLKFSGTEEVDLIFHVSNFGYNDGGFWSALEIGLEEDINRIFYFGMIKEVFLFGSILIMGLYHVGFYFFRRSEKSILYFSIFCFLIAIRTIVTGNRIFLDIFPTIPWDLFYRLEYMSFYMAPAPFFLFVKSLYESLMLHRLNRLYILATFAFIPTTLFPIYFFTQTVRYFQILTLIGVIYVFAIVIRATLNKKQGARLFLFGWIAMSAAVVYDIIIDMLNIRSIYISSYGFIVFIFSQSLILSARFSKAFKAAEDLTEELSSYKTSLEEKVEKRTKDISFLNQISKEVNSSFDLDSIVGQVYNYVNEGFGIESLWMLTIDRKENVIRTSQWVGFDFLTLEQSRVFQNMTIPLNEKGGTLFRTYKKKKIFYLPYLNPDLVQGYDRIIVELLQLNSLIQIPLTVHGQVVAILCATSYKNGLKLNKSQQSVLSSIAEQIAGAVHNSLLLNQAVESKRESEKAYKESETLADITKKISSNSSIEDIFKEVEVYLQENFQLNYHWLLLVDEEKNHLYTSIFRDNGLTGPTIRKKYMKIKIPISPESGSLYATVMRKKPFYLPKIPQKGIVGFDKTIIEDLKLQSFVQIPILMNDKVVGVLTSTNLGENIKLSPNDLKRILRFANQIGGAIHNTELLEAAEKEREISNNLLMNILPVNIANELKKTGQVQPVQYEAVTILFTDFKGFTRLAETMNPTELINQLEGSFFQFDEITERFRLEKLKTIGDSYMCAGGIPIKNDTHAFDACLAAIEIRSFMDQAIQMRRKLGLPTWELRIGIHTGPVIAGVIGKKKFAYDIWGDTVNIASRMESTGTEGKINISETTYQLIKDFFVCSPRGFLDVKNKGKMGMYYVESIIPELSVRGEGTAPNKLFYEKLGGTTLQLPFETTSPL
jgi:class 3 adenylate cyclase